MGWSTMFLVPCTAYTVLLHPLYGPHYTCYAEVDLDELGDTPPAPLCDGGSRTLGMKYNLKLNPQLFC